MLHLSKFSNPLVWCFGKKFLEVKNRLIILAVLYLKTVPLKYPSIRYGLCLPNNESNLFHSILKDLPSPSFL